jgi:hypothetical protein
MHVHPGPCTRHVTYPDAHADSGGILQGRECGWAQQDYVLLPGPHCAVLLQRISLWLSLPSRLACQACVFLRLPTEADAMSHRQPPKSDPKSGNKLTFADGREDSLTGKCVYFVRVNPKVPMPRLHFSIETN